MRLDGAKDVSDLHIQNPEHFKEKLRVVFKGARRWDDEVRAASGGTQSRSLGGLPGAESAAHDASCFLESFEGLF